jgi:glucose/arabinose dehydrogenase
VTHRIILPFILLLGGLASLNAAASPYGLENRVAGGAFLDGKMPELGPEISGNWSTVIAFPKLKFKNPVGLLPVPGIRLLAIWEREGRLWTFNDSADASSQSLVLDISNQCQGWDDCGMLGVACHPDFVHNHYVFVWYTWVVPGSVVGNPRKRPATRRANHNHLSRFTLDANGVAIAGSEVVLVDQECTSIWHKGGGMFFHPTNGFLYFTVGDDEDGSNAQRIDHNLFGGLFRIDVDCRGGNISHPIRNQPANGHTANYFRLIRLMRSEFHAARRF